MLVNIIRALYISLGVDMSSFNVTKGHYIYTYIFIAVRQ